MEIPLISALKKKFIKDKFAFGLDIGSFTIKVVKLKLSKDGAELCDYKIAPSEFDVIAVLKKLKDSENLDSANISFSGISTVIRYVNFPKMSPEDLKKSLKFEAQKYIPFSIEEVNFDSYILKENLPDNKMLVLLAAVKKDFMSQRRKILEGAGIKTAVAEIDSTALTNSFCFNYGQDSELKDKTVGLLNIGGSLSNLNIIENGLPCLSRDIHIAGSSFTQKIADAFGIDVKSVESLKLKPNKEQEEKISQAADSVVARLASEIRTSFDYYESQQAASVGKIFLSGGGSLLLAIKEGLANLLGIEVDYWDPLKKITIAADLDAQQVRACASQLAVAVGLALHSY